jgi:hypothetical protein
MVSARSASFADIQRCSNTASRRRYRAKDGRRVHHPRIRHCQAFDSPRPRSVTRGGLCKWRSLLLMHRWRAL